MGFIWMRIVDIGLKSQATGDSVFFLKKCFYSWEIQTHSSFLQRDNVYRNFNSKITREKVGSHLRAKSVERPLKIEKLC